MEQEGSVAAAARAAATAAAQTAVAATAQAAVEPAVVAMAAMAMGAAAPEPKERMSEVQTGGARPKGEEEDVPRRKPVCTQESVQALANFQRLTKGTGAQGLHPLLFRSGLGLLGVDDEFASLVFRIFDTDRDGVVTRREFVHVSTTLLTAYAKLEPNEHAARLVFRAFNAKRDGRLTREELHKVNEALLATMSRLGMDSGLMRVRPPVERVLRLMALAATAPPWPRLPSPHAAQPRPVSSRQVHSLRRVADDVCKQLMLVLDPKGQVLRPPCIACPP